MQRECELFRQTYTGHVHQEVVKELPDMVGRVDLLHFYFCVHVAMIDKVHISRFHLQDIQKVAKE